MRKVIDKNNKFTYIDDDEEKEEEENKTQNTKIHLSDEKEKEKEMKKEKEKEKKKTPNTGMAFVPMNEKMKEKFDRDDEKWKTYKNGEYFN